MVIIVVIILSPSLTSFLFGFILWVAKLKLCVVDFYFLAFDCLLHGSSALANWLCAFNILTSRSWFFFRNLLKRS